MKRRESGGESGRVTAGGSRGPLSPRRLIYCLGKALSCRLGPLDAPDALFMAPEHGRRDGGMRDDGGGRECALSASVYKQGMRPFIHVYIYTLLSYPLVREKNEREMGERRRKLRRERSGRCRSIELVNGGALLAGVQLGREGRSVCLRRCFVFDGTFFQDGA